MRLLDQGLPRSIVHLMRDAGMDAVHVGDIGMARATDLEILRQAEQERRIVVTLDADFHTLLACSGASMPSVIRIREEGLKAPALHKLILNLWQCFSAPLSNGCVITATTSQARLRHLPIK